MFESVLGISLVALGLVRVEDQLVNLIILILSLSISVLVFVTWAVPIIAVLPLYFVFGICIELTTSFLV